MKEIKDLNLKSKKDLEKMELVDLRKELTDSKKRYFSLKMKLELNELKQTHLIKALRKYIAVINTIASSKNNLI